MDLLDGDVAYDLIFKSYARNQKGWRFTLSPSANHGFFDAFVTNADEGWQLKFDTVFKPSPIVLGARVEPSRSQVAAPPNRFSFGYRPLGPSFIQQLKGLEQGVLPGRLAAALATAKPVVPQAGRAYAQGPIILTQTKPGAFSPEQVRIDERLSSEMLKRVRVRYPGYG